MLQQLIGLALILAAILLYWKPKLLTDRRDKPLFHLADTPFTERQLCGSVLIFGQSGSGKTSGSGRFFQHILLSIYDSGGLVITSKPEERNDWIRAAVAAGRHNDIIVFAPDEKFRINFLDQLGGDPTNIVNALDVIAGMMAEKGTKGADPFWPRSRNELFEHAVTILKLANQPISGASILHFINGAATSLEQVKSDEWKKGFHWRVLSKAVPRTRRDRFSYDVSYPFWVSVWPQKDPKTRSNVLAEAMGVLHPFNTGLVRDLIGTETNVPLDSLFKGRILICDTPLQTMGKSGQFIAATIKYCVQRMILARDAKPEDAPVFIFCDEAHNHFSSFDPIVLAEQRSHKGIAIYLTQGVNAVYDIVGEKAAKSLFTNFYLKVFHQLGSEEDGAYGAGLLGQRIDVTTSGGPDEQGNFRPSFAENYFPVLQPESFLSSDLRASGGIARAIVISGDRFKSGERYAYVPFKQG